MGGCCCGNNSVEVKKEETSQNREVEEKEVIEESIKETANEEPQKIKEPSVSSDKEEEREIGDGVEEVQSVNNNIEENNNHLPTQKNDVQKNKPMPVMKNKKKKNAKAPYIIIENITDPYQMLSLTIFAYGLKDEVMLPIWVDKDKYLKFKVTGQWCIDKKYDYTDSTGMPCSRSKKFNYGALIGRINDEEPFVVYDELTQLTKKGGPLYLKMNLPKNLKLTPQGSLNLNIYDGTYMEIEEINKRIGWKESGENYENASPSEIENEVANNINNLRVNPFLFYEKYIQKNQNLSWTVDYIKKVANIERNPMVMVDEYYQLLSQFLSKSIIKENLKTIHKNNTKTFIKKLEQNIYSFFIGKIEDDPIITCKLTKKTNPIEICIRYLLDVDFRNNIFDENSQSFAIKILSDIYTDSHLIILMLTKNK